MKKVFQLVVISEAALDEPPAAADAGADVVAGADEEAAVDAAAAGLVAAGAVEDELELLLEQADSAVTSTRPSAGAR